MTPVRISFDGHSAIRQLQQRTSAHLEHFLNAANWFVANQDEDGGWSIPVERYERFYSIIAHKLLFLLLLSLSLLLLSAPTFGWSEIYL